MGMCRAKRGVLGAIQKLSRKVALWATLCSACLGQHTQAAQRQMKSSDDFNPCYWSSKEALPRSGPTVTQFFHFSSHVFSVMPSSGSLGNKAYLWVSGKRNADSQRLRQTFNQSCRINPPEHVSVKPGRWWWLGYFPGSRPAAGINRRPGTLWGPCLTRPGSADLSVEMSYAPDLWPPLFLGVPYFKTDPNGELRLRNGDMQQNHGDMITNKKVQYVAGDVWVTLNMAISKLMGIWMGKMMFKYPNLGCIFQTHPSWDLSSGFDRPGQWQPQ